MLIYDAIDAIHSSSWLQTFVELQGVSVLATALNNINRKTRREADVTLEYEILKCLKILLGKEVSGQTKCWVRR